LHLDNCPEFFFCWFGLAKIGAIMVPINARLLHDESLWILQNSRASLLVTTENFYPLYRRIHQEGKTQLNHICLIDRNFCVSDTAVSDFTNLSVHNPSP
jgi:crotonobetaine/carnitine-CoA ligase